MFFRHSARYYRNLLLLWFTVLLVLLGAWLRSEHWSTVIWLIPAAYLVLILWSTFRMVHPRRRAMLRRITPKDAGLAFEEVDFPGREGNRLAGWYIPGQNRRAIILVHGLGGSGATLVEHARILNTAGYAILLLDLRAHGYSAGDTATFGILEAQDVLGAVDYLRTRNDVDADKIGALGISLGAQAVLRAALVCPALAALALEGLGPTTPADHGQPATFWQRWINRLLNIFAYEMGNLMSGVWPVCGTRAALARLPARPLLVISTGRGGEQRFARLCYQQAQEPKSLWEVERAAHGGAYVVRKKEYRERLLRLFDGTLL